jgi:hypothetical protein
MDELVQAIIYTRADDFFTAHHDRPYTNNLTDILLRKHIGFKDLYKFGVFGLDATAVSTVPNFNKEFQNNDIILPGKTVILSPYAKSVGQIPSDFWIDLAQKKAADGFTVLTNTVGDELPVPGTKPLFIPITEMVSAAEIAGHFIGVRSGLCDIISTAKCEKTIIFPDSFYSYTGVKVSEFFALDGFKNIIYYE